MKILLVVGRYAYGDPARGQGYEYTNMLSSLRALGHEVVHFESFDRRAYADFAALNQAFLQAVRRERPELVFCVLMSYEIWTETLDLVRRNGYTVLNWGTDDSWKYSQFARFIAQHVDCYATTSDEALARARQAGMDNVVGTQWGASDSLLAPPRPARECTYQVSFVGAAYGNRRRWIGALTRAGIPVECFGHGWPNGPVAAAEVTRVIRDSVVTLNFGDSGLHVRGVLPYRSRQIKARVFEVPGAGGMLVTEVAAGLERYFSVGTEVIAFRTPGELCEQVQYLLSHPLDRDRIAQRGYERARADHTYTRRFAQLLERVKELRSSSGLSSRPPHQDSPAEIEQLVQRHRIGPGLKALRWLLTSAARPVLGPHRGPRAARRALFELSWRIAGARTYSAAGWPGRLFYRES